ncbi:MAG: dihydroorotate dehydrogenase B catalytic subunit [Desulfobacterales bacterium]|nr:MAG: dihydroorotate dehydrogenase B catalytic subunit [Desulfobacterales bacterium]
MEQINLGVDIGGIALENPVMTASGTFGYGIEYHQFVDLDAIGGIVVKGISMEPRKGNPPQRIVETPCGMLNAIGLENVGFERFVKEKLPFLRSIKCKVLVNILGDSIEEYAYLAGKLSEHAGIDGLEVNISCPNVKKGGVAFGTVPEMARAVTRAVKETSSLPVIVKLSPNVTDIVTMAKAVEDGGADAISLINTLIGMAINAQTRRPVLANVIGGLSGPAIKPVALRMVWQVASNVSVPVIGIGGISTAEDAIEFLIAGATAVQLGTANFFEPSAADTVANGILEYLKAHDETDVNAIIGSLQLGG